MLAESFANRPAGCASSILGFLEQNVSCVASRFSKKLSHVFKRNSDRIQHSTTFANCSSSTTALLVYSAQKQSSTEWGWTFIPHTSYSVKIQLRKQQ